MNEVAKKERTPQEIAVEINVIKHQTMQMVAMFALPMESRKELLEDNPNLPEMSARDVQRLVKEKQAAEEERDRERKQRERAEKLATTLADRADKVKAALKKAEEEREQLKSQTSMIQADTTEKDNEIAELKAQLEELKSRPVEATYTEFTEEEKEKIRREAMAEAAAEIEKATKKASASQAVQQINFAFREIQRQFETAKNALTECKKKEPKTAERLKNVIATTLSMLAGKVEKL